MLGQCRRRWANIDLILFPEFYKQTIKKNYKKNEVEGRGSRVVGRGARGSRVGFRDIRLRARPAGNQRCKLVQRLISLLGIYG